MSEYIKLDDSVYFTANFYHPTSGFSYAADATPRYLVYESGATLILQGDMTVRDTIVGSYWGNFIASTANGFNESEFYDVQVSGTVGGVSGFSKVKEFVLSDIYNANTVQVSGEYVAMSDAVYDANVTQVSGVNVSLVDFGGTGGSGASAAEVRAEMDANSLMLSAISGQALTALAVRTELDVNSLQLTAISGNVAGLAGAAMRGTDNAATSVQLMSVSGSILDANIVQVSGINVSGTATVDANIVQVSGQYVSIENFRNTLTTTDLYNQASGALVNYDAATYADLLTRTLPSGEYGVSDLTATDIRTEMDANSLMLTAISGQALTASEVRTEMDANSLMLSAISGQALTAVEVRTEMDANSLMLIAISGDIGGLNSDIYFAHIKYVSDLTNNQDEFAVQWFKNDQPVGSGDLTNPRISVYNTSTGAAVFAGQSMNYASSNLGVVRYNTSMVLASGEPYLVETSGTIDSVMRNWKTIVGIDLL